MARDIILREVPGYGWLPIIVNQETGNEEYRGEFRDTTGIALEYAERALDEREILDAPKPKKKKKKKKRKRSCIPMLKKQLDRIGDKYDSQNIPESK